MKTRRSAATEPRTPATGGTPWKGRLRSHHVTPQSVPTQRLPSRAMNWEEAEEVRTSKKRAAPKTLERGCNAGAARLSKTPPRRSLWLTGNDAEHPIIIDEECEPRNNRLAIKPLRRSPRFKEENNNSTKQVLPPDRGEFSCNRKTEKALRKNKSQVSLKKNRGKARVKSQKEPLERRQVSQDIFPGNKIADVSHKKSGKQEVEPRQSEVMTGKRKRCRDSKSSHSDCQEITAITNPRKSIDKNIEKDPSIIRHPKIGDVRLKNVDEINKVASEVEREGREHSRGSDDWTEEQDMALRNAYFTARPSPHFWKKVSKMVPGRSAEECFNRIHADLSTPTPIASRPRTSKTFSPLGKFTLSDSKLPNLSERTVLRQKTTKQKNLASQKKVRHLLQKHCLMDQAQEADHFSLFETSPGATQLNIYLEGSPGTPGSYMNSGSLNKCSGSSSARKKPLSRLRTKQAVLSPAVLKPIKNAVLHERYINQLSRREGSKRARKRTPGSKDADSEKNSKKQASGLKAAKNALIAEATDFIGRFKKLQANSHAHIVENSENDCIE